MHESFAHLAYFFLNHIPAPIHKDSTVYQADQNCSIVSEISPNSCLHPCAISMFLLRIKSGRGSEVLVQQIYTYRPEQGDSGP